MTTPIAEISQLLSPDQLVELITVDATSIGGDLMHFAPYPENDPSPGDIVFGGIAYVPIPMTLTGFASDSQGTQPQPTLTVSNIGGVFSAAIEGLNDMKGAVVTRTRTYRRFLDNGSEPDPSMYMPQDIYLVDQKSAEDNTHIEFRLASAIDQQNVQLPGGLVLKRTCTHIYRLANPDGTFSYANVTCPYTGTSYFDEAGNVTTAPNDSCGRLVSDCILRFGNAPLPTRAFPGVLEST
jgi:lambda family phage minor tail protein L